MLFKLLFTDFIVLLILMAIVKEMEDTWPEWIQGLIVFGTLISLASIVVLALAMVWTL